MVLSVALLYIFQTKGPLIVELHAIISALKMSMIMENSRWLTQLIELHAIISALNMLIIENAGWLTQLAPGLREAQTRHVVPLT